MSEALIDAVIAGVLASLACGLGVLPLAWPKLDVAKHRGVGYALAGGLMMAASVYNLILPGLDMGEAGWGINDVGPILIGILLGAVFLAIVDKYLHNHEAVTENSTASSWGGRVGILVFIAMTFHSIPEGVAVGVGYTSDAVNESVMAGEAAALGPVLALAIAIHNIPEGLAVALPMRSSGASLFKCFWAAVFTSLPQPLAAIPAVLLAWFFEPLMPFMMGFAAGAMIFLIVLDLIPEALEDTKPQPMAWSFLLGFCGMLLVQVLL